MKIEVRHARLVVALAETGSISKASALLALPQPSVSAQLRRIEKAIGGALFIRSRVGVEPTELGERLIPMLAELAARADAIVAWAEEGRARALRIGIVEWTPVGLQQIIQASVPQAVVHTETLDAAAALTAVQQGTLDVAIVHSFGESVHFSEPVPALATRTVVEEPVWLALPPTTDGAALEPSALRSLRWVLRGRDHWFHGVEKHFFERVLGFEPTVVHRAAGHAEAMSWVRDAGVAALATPTAASRDVNFVRIGGANGPRSRIALLSRRGVLSEQVATDLVRGVRTYYCEYARSLPWYWSWLTADPDAVPELAGILTTG